MVILAGVPVSAVALSFISSIMQPSIVAQELEKSRGSKLATNAISAIDVVKCSNGQDLEASEYAASVSRAAVFYLKQAWSNALQIGFVRFVTSSMFVQGFWYGSHLVRNGETSAGNVATAFWSCLMATKAFEDILPNILVLEKGRAAGIKLKAILDHVERGRTVVKAACGATPKFCEGDIEVREVCPPSFLRPW